VITLLNAEIDRIKAATLTSALTSLKAKIDQLIQSKINA
jgi:hypothetical protein